MTYSLDFNHNILLDIYLESFSFLKNIKKKSKKNKMSLFIPKQQR